MIQVRVTLPDTKMVLWTMPSWTDCGIEIIDGTLLVWDYSLRKKAAGHSGLIAGYAPGAWASVGAVEVLAN